MFAVWTEHLMLGPLLDAFEVVVVATYCQCIALVFQTDAAFIINDVKVYDLAVEGIQRLHIHRWNSLHRDGNYLLWTILHSSAVLDHGRDHH
jgi:hypothetical protein